jgi:predicted nucleic acid-binding protein
MDATGVKVVDASALAAVIFDEPEAEDIARRLRGAVLVAPPLLMFEIANVSLMKLRRNPDQRAGILQAFELRGGLTFTMAEVDHADVLLLAEETGLTAYDASYLWLARQLNAELVTLDRALARAAAPIAPDG